MNRNADDSDGANNHGFYSDLLRQVEVNVGKLYTMVMNRNADDSDGANSHGFYSDLLRQVKVNIGSNRKI